MIPDETIEQVRDSTDIVGLIGESVTLKRTGSDYRGPCPFHGGTNRNFAVIPKKGRYYCFVCHESGDVFSWFMKRMGLDYPTAVREAARRTGIVIPDRGERAGPDPHEALYSAMSVGHDWFARQLLELPDASGAREYLQSRDIPLETAAMLGLGFAPVGNTFLKAMTELGVEERVLLEAGLAAQRDDGTVIPRFRRRLLFPIHDLRGRIVGLGGRLLGPGEPKYLNSPETEIFHKGKQLYNLHQARSAIRKEESVLLVEGYFDVIRLSLAGVDHVVAPLGTALTPELRATFRAVDELLRHAIRVRVATLPPGEDPDTLVRKTGVEGLDAVLRDALDLLERKIQLLERKGFFEGVEHRRDALDRLLPTIRAASDPITRELYLSLVAERAGVSKEVLERELAEGGKAGRRDGGNDAPAGPAPGVLPRKPRGRRNPETQLLAAMLAAPELIVRAREDISPALLEKSRLREIFEVLIQSDGHTGQLPENLSEGSAAAWSYLKEAADELSSQEVSTLYDKAAQILQARAHYRVMDGLTDPGEKKRIRADLRARYPAADAWYEYQKAAARGARAT
jgi:DNA primase